MLNKLQVWKDKILNENINYEILLNKNDTIIKKNILEKEKILLKIKNIIKKQNKKHIFHMTTILPNKPDFYFDYLWNVDKMHIVNKNIISNIDILTDNSDKKELITTYKFSIKDVVIQDIKRKEYLFLEKPNKNNVKYIIYNYFEILNVIENDVDIGEEDIPTVKDGIYSICVSELNGQTHIEYISEFNSFLTKISKRIPVLIIEKIIKNFKNI